MHINVRDFLAEEVGYDRTFAITSERPVFESLKLTEDLRGELTISRLEDGLLVRGNIQTSVQLECHRCLRTFVSPVQVAFAHVYRQRPQDDDLPIEGDHIDVAPLIEQEILVNLPIKLLCRLDCPGIKGAAEEYTKAKTGPRLRDQARITKGSSHARISRPQKTNDS